MALISMGLQRSSLSILQLIHALGGIAALQASPVLGETSQQRLSLLPREYAERAESEWAEPVS